MSELKPTFDFTKVSRQWSKAMSASIQKATRAQLTLQRPAPTGDAAAIQAHVDNQLAAIDVIENISDEQAELVAQVLKDVPREWLIEGAPDALDFSRIASFDWIQEARYGEILELLTTGEARKLQEAKIAAKN